MLRYKIRRIHSGRIECARCRSALKLAQTPDPGINFDTTSVIKAPVEKGRAGERPLGWYRTMIECNKEGVSEKPQNWPEISQGAQGVWLHAPPPQLTVRVCQIGARSPWDPWTSPCGAWRARRVV